jgi:hypothetical protein
MCLYMFGVSLLYSGLFYCVCTTLCLVENSEKSVGTCTRYKYQVGQKFEIHFLNEIFFAKIVNAPFHCKYKFESISSSKIIYQCVSPTIIYFRDMYIKVFQRYYSEYQCDTPNGQQITRAVTVITVE